MSRNTFQAMTNSVYAITDEALRAGVTADVYSAIERGAPHTMSRDQIRRASEPFASRAEATDHLRLGGGGWWFDDDANAHYVSPRHDARNKRS